MNTKERILQEALKLFAQNGYMATSMSDIAKHLDITKPALYKHYASKQEIFDSILERMRQMDQERMTQYQMPEGTMEGIGAEYNKTPLEKITLITKVQFKHWTEEEFSCNFRKMLTLEQYRSKEMKDLFQMYLGDGIVNYMIEVFTEMLRLKGRDIKSAKQIALEFYGPIYLLIGVYDNFEDKEQVFTLVEEHIHRFAKLEDF